MLTTIDEFHDLLDYNIFVGVTVSLSHRYCLNQVRCEVLPLSRRRVQLTKITRAQHIIHVYVLAFRVSDCAVLFSPTMSTPPRPMLKSISTSKSVDEEDKFNPFSRRLAIGSD